MEGLNFHPVSIVGAVIFGVLVRQSWMDDDGWIYIEEEGTSGIGPRESSYSEWVPALLSCGCWGK